MSTTGRAYAGKDGRILKKHGLPRWQHIVLLSVLGYEGLGALSGGMLLVLTPDGSSMDMPVDMLHGAFHDLLVPGLILFGLGVLNAAAFVAVLRGARHAWVLAGSALGGLAIWFWVEIAVLQHLHWLHAMWGLPVIVGCLAALPLILPRHLSMRRTLLVCGMLSSLLYAAVNLIVPSHYPGYSATSRTVSELSAIGAPTRMLWSVLVTPYTLLMLAFAWGVRRSAGGDRRLRIAGGLMLAYGASGCLWPFAPMHQREVLAAGGATFSDTMHLALGAVTEVLYLLALVFAAGALGTWFRIYSTATFIILLVFGVLTFLDAPALSTNGPTPLIGIRERINIGVFLLWVVVLAATLLRPRPAS